MRVALLTPSAFPEVHRGTERVVADLARGLAAAGHVPWVVTSHPGAPSLRREDGALVLRSWRPPEHRLRRRGFQEHLTHLPASALALAAARADVAHAHFPTDALVATRWAARTGRPALFTYHGLAQREVLTARRHRWPLIRRALRESDAVVVGSALAAAGMRRWLGHEPRVIHPGVDLDAFAPGPGREEHPTLVCAADAGDPRKRVPVLLEALGLLRRERDVRLLLPTPASPPLAARLAGVPGVELVAPTADPRVLAATYRRAWVSVLPSFNEAFGMVLAESLACGVPVVGSADGGAREIIGEAPVGALAPVDDAPALAAALHEVLGLSQEAGTAAACRARAARFSTAASTAAHVALYGELAARAGAPRR